MPVAPTSPCLTSLRSSPGASPRLAERRRWSRLRVPPRNLDVLMPRATLRLFGAPSLTDAAGGRIESLLAQPKRFAVLAYLAVEARENPVTRDKVATLFWPELDQSRARQALRQSLHVI